MNMNWWIWKLPAQWFEEMKQTDEMSLSSACRCDGGVLRVWCGGVPCFPDVAHHRGKNTGIFRERQNRGAALPTSPVGHAASSQARMQRQTAPGGAREHTHFSLHKLLRLFLKCRQMEVHSHFLACFLLLLFAALSIKWGTPNGMHFCFIAEFVITLYHFCNCAGTVQTDCCCFTE